MKRQGGREDEEVHVLYYFVGGKFPLLSKKREKKMRREMVFVQKNFLIDLLEGEMEGKLGGDMSVTYFL